MPTRSGARQRPRSDTCGMMLRHRYDEVGLPCRMTIGSPSPDSTWWIVVSSTRVRGMVTPYRVWDDSQRVRVELGYDFRHPKNVGPNKGPRGLWGKRPSTLALLAVLPGERTWRCRCGNGRPVHVESR